MSRSVCQHCGFVVEEPEYHAGLDQMARHYVDKHGSFTYSDGSVRRPAPISDITDSDEFIYVTLGRPEFRYVSRRASRTS